MIVIIQWLINLVTGLIAAIAGALAGL